MGEKATFVDEGEREPGTNNPTNDVCDTDGETKHRQASVAGIDGWSESLLLQWRWLGLLFISALNILLCPERELAISQAEKYEAPVSNNICDSKVWKL